MATVRRGQQLSKCKYADKYKGIKAPKCGCETCKIHYAQVQAIKNWAAGKSQAALGWAKRANRVLGNDA